MISKNSKIFLVSLSFIALVFLSALIFGVYDVKSKNTETSILLNEADLASENGELAQSIKTIRANAEEDLEIFESLVLTSDKLVPLIESIEKAGQGFGLGTKIVSVGKIDSQNASQPNMIRMIVETEGPWASTFSFMQALENLPYRVIVDESSFSEIDVDWRLRVTLLLHLFD